MRAEPRSRGVDVTGIECEVGSETERVERLAQWVIAGFAGKSPRDGLVDVQPCVTGATLVAVQRAERE